MEVQIFKKLEEIYECLDDGYRAEAYHKVLIELRKGTNNFSDDIRGKIQEIYKTGKLRKLEELSNPKNISICNLVKILGIGPKKAEELYDSGIKTYLDFLVSDVKKTKLQEFGLKHYQTINTTHDKKFLKKVLKEIKNDINEEIHVAGSSRYILEKFPDKHRPLFKTSKDLDIIIVSRKKLKKLLYNLYLSDLLLDQYLINDWEAYTILELDGRRIKVDFKVTTKKYLGSYLLFFGSGKYFSKWIRRYTKKNNMKLNRYGLEIDGKLKTYKNERDIFKDLDLDYIPVIDRFENY